MSNNISKKQVIIILLILGIVGAFINFYATGLLCSDLSNMFYGVHDAYIVSSIPLFMIAVDFVVAFIFVVRFYRHTDIRKSLINTYTIFGMVNSILGIVGCVLTAIIYKSIIKPYPFPFYVIIMFLLNAVIFAIMLLLNIKNKGRVGDTQKIKIGVKYILFNTYIGCALYYALNRLGAFLWAPIYIQWSTLYMTFPFYLLLLVPLCMLLFVLSYFIGGFKSKTQYIWGSSILSLINLVLGVTVFIIGYNYPLFISAISPALAIERLASKPLEIIIGFIGLFAVNIAFIVEYVVYMNTRHKEKIKK